MIRFGIHQGVYIILLSEQAKSNREAMLNSFTSHEEMPGAGSNFFSLNIYVLDEEGI